MTSERPQRLLVLGAGPLQTPVILAAKRMGLFVVALDGNADAEGLAHADRPYEIDISNAEACLSIAVAEEIDGAIHPCSEISIRVLGRLNDELNLSGPGVEVMTRTTSKAMMRQILTDADLPVPDWRSCRTPAEFSSAVDGIGPPVIVKPGWSSGSRGVTLLITSDDARVAEAFAYASGESRDGTVLVEEFIDGPELSVETLTWNGRTHVVALTDKQTSGAPHFVETGHSQPSSVDAAAAEQIVDVATRAIGALGIDWSAAHPEVRIGPRGPTVIEVGPRLGGDYITTHLVPLSTGVSMSESAIELALGRTPTKTSPRTATGAAIRFLTPRPGIVERIDGLDRARKQPNIEDVAVQVGIGARIPTVTSSGVRSGHVLATGKDGRDALAHAEEAVRQIHFVVD